MNRCPSPAVVSFQPESQEQQEQLGARLAGCCPVALVVYLEGDLGAGKTTLVRGFLRGFGYQGRVKSPTYTLIEPYRVAGNSICHLDLYRLADAGELEYLGIRDLLQERTTLLIEWPERGEGVLPVADLIIRIGYREHGRAVEISAATAAGEHAVAGLSRLATDPLS